MIDNRILHGGDYNPEQWLESPKVLEEDIIFMKAAKVNCVTLGVFSWALEDVLGVIQEEIDAPGDDFVNSFVYESRRYSVGHLREVCHPMKGTETLSVYGQDFYEGLPVLTKNSYGRGRSYYLAAETEMDFLRVFYGELFREAGLENALGVFLPYGVTVTAREGKTRTVFVMNFSHDPVRLALIGGNSRHYVTESRKQGFVDAHGDMGIPANDARIFMEVEDYRRASWAVEQALAMEADGIVCMDDSIRNLVLGCLRERGVEIPSMIKLASLYDSHRLERNLPPVTSLRFDTKELGRNACRRMLELLGEHVEGESSQLGYQVILRESTK